MIYFFPLLVYWISALSNKKASLYLVLLLVLFMVLLCGLRWETGTDWLPYYNQYNSNEFRTDFESGYLLLVNFLSSNNFSYTEFLIISSFITVGLIALTINCFLGNRLLPFVLFYSSYYLSSFLGSQRRIFAISLCCLSLVYIAKKKIFPFLLSVFLAGSFHLSGLFFLPAYFIYHAKSFFSVFFMAFIFAFLMLLAFVFICENNLIQEFERFGNKILEYSNDGFNYQNLLSLGGVKRIFFSLFFYYGLRKNALNPLYVGYLKLYFFGVLFYFITVLINPIFTILTSYYSIVEIFLISFFISGLRFKNSLLVPILSIYLMLEIYSACTLYKDLYFPYISIFSNFQREVIY
jgi:hypothetical protein